MCKEQKQSNEKVMTKKQKVLLISVRDITERLS